MKIFNAIASGSLVLLALASCTTTLPGYSPNAPLLGEKGDARISAGAVLGGVTAGANLQVAYAPWNHVYFGAGTSLLSHTGSTTSNFTDISMGYFGRSGGTFAYEFSAGGGLGSFKYEGSEKDLLNRVHVQAAAAYVSDHIQAGGGIRLASNSYRFSGGPADPDPNGGITLYEGDYSGIVSLEPFFLMRIGGPRIGCQVMATLPFITNDILLVDPDPTLSLGVTFKLGKKK